jgi:hypothetical protein
MTKFLLFIQLAKRKDVRPIPCNTCQEEEAADDTNYIGYVPEDT